LAVFGSKIPIRKVKFGKKSWILDCRSVGGRREFYKTREEAETARDRKITEVRNYGTAALSLRHEERLDFVRSHNRLANLDPTINDVTLFCEKAPRPDKASPGIRSARAATAGKGSGRQPRAIKQEHACLRRPQQA